MTDNIPPHVISQIYDIISDPELMLGGTGVFWADFSFMERTGFDVATLKPDLLYSIREWRETFPDDSFETEGYERGIALGLRDIARDQAGLPPLTHDERTSWIFETPKLKSYWWKPNENDPKLRDNSELTVDEIDRIIAYIARNTPEVFRFIALVKRFNLSLDGGGNYRDPRIVYAAWSTRVIVDAIANLFGETGARPLLHSLRAVKDEICRREANTA